MTAMSEHDSPFPDDVEPYIEGIKTGGPVTAAKSSTAALKALATGDPSPTELELTLQVIADSTKFTKTSAREELESLKTDARAEVFEIESVTLIRPEGDGDEDRMMEVTGWFDGEPFRWFDSVTAFQNGHPEVRARMDEMRWEHDIDFDAPSSNVGWRELTESWVQSAKESGTFTVATEPPTRPAHVAVERVCRDLERSSLNPDPEDWASTLSDLTASVLYLGGDEAFLTMRAVESLVGNVEEASVRETVSVMLDRGIASRQPFEPSATSPVQPEGARSVGRVLPLSVTELLDRCLFDPADFEEVGVEYDGE